MTRTFALENTHQRVGGKQLCKGVLQAPEAPYGNFSFATGGETAQLAKSMRVPNVGNPATQKATSAHVRGEGICPDFLFALVLYMPPTFSPRSNSGVPAGIAWHTSAASKSELVDSSTTKRHDSMLLCPAAMDGR